MTQKPLILIVEDTKEHSDLFIKLLNHFGYSYSLEETGQGALAFCAKTVPTLILMDISLPDISGIQVMLTLKALETFQKVPIIALSAYSSDNLLKQGSKGLFDDYLSKPFTIEEFLNKIKKHLD